MQTVQNRCAWYQNGSEGTQRIRFEAAKCDWLIQSWKGNRFYQTQGER